MRRLACLCIVVGLWGRAAASRDIFVNNTAGDDRFTGAAARNLTETSGPVKTIAKALRMAASGDHIFLADSGQPYRESISLVGSRHSGALLSLLIDGGGAVLDGSVPVPADQWHSYQGNIFRFRPPAMAGAVLFLEGHALLRVPVAYAKTAPPKLAPQQWCSIEGWIYFAVEPGKLPGDYKLAYAALTSGITLLEVDRVVIKDLTVQGFQADGIAALSGARRVVLNGVTCRDNGRSGVSVGETAQVELTACKLTHNVTAQLLTLPYSQTHIYESDLTDDIAPGWVDRGGTVYLGKRRVQGGLKAVVPADAKREPAPEKSGQKKP